LKDEKASNLKTEKREEKNKKSKRKNIWPVIV